MNRIASWIKSWVTKYRSHKNEEKQSSLVAQTTSQKNHDFYQNYFSLIANGARLKLVEAMFNLNLFALFEKKPFILEHEIIKSLELQPIRAKKWLNLLCSEDFLIKKGQGKKVAYQLSEGFMKLTQCEHWETTKFYFSLSTVAENENLTDALRFGKVDEGYANWAWPPNTQEQSAWLEDWMTKTASHSIRSLLERINFDQTNHLLDVGGGDGTVACALVTAHPHLRATVYNLPASAEIARQRIESKGLSHRVNVIEGDFIEEHTFPGRYDLILFTRVLFDWNERVNRKLLKMAYSALQKNGCVAICEFFKEDNRDICLASEYRYIFIDALDVNLMKTMAEYRSMLSDIGFSMMPYKKINQSRSSVLLAQK